MAEGRSVGANVGSSVGRLEGLGVGICVGGRHLLGLLVLPMYIMLTPVEL